MACHVAYMYISYFLQVTMETITRLSPQGVPEWASDREVIQGHFKQRTRLIEDNAVEDDGSHHPMVLSMSAIRYHPVTLSHPRPHHMS